MRFALYGDEPVVDHRFAKIKQAFEQYSRVPRSWVQNRSPGDVSKLEHPADLVQAGVPNLVLEHEYRCGTGEKKVGTSASRRSPRLTSRDAVSMATCCAGSSSRRPGSTTSSATC